MQTPPYLKTGDQVRIISTARKISKAELDPALKKLKAWGLEVSLGKNLFAEDHQFAGSRIQRTEDLQTAMDQENIKAIICARGGYGSVQLIDQLDFSSFKQQPKWLVGYSDVTVLHNHINQNFDIETLHATMPINFSDEPNSLAEESLRKALFGEVLEYHFDAEEASILAFDELSAPVFGGNLSILYSLTGTDSQIKQKGHFIFMEDLDEYLYHIDRMMMNLKRAGVFEGCKGILVGGMTDMNDNTTPYGSSAQEIIVENCRELEIPLVFGVPAGHIKDNLALIMGRKVRLYRKGQKIRMAFDGRA